MGLNVGVKETAWRVEERRCCWPALGMIDSNYNCHGLYCGACTHWSSVGIGWRYARTFGACSSSCGLLCHWRVDRLYVGHMGVREGHNRWKNKGERPCIDRLNDDKVSASRKLFLLFARRSRLIEGIDVPKTKLKLNYWSKLDRKTRTVEYITDSLVSLISIRVFCRKFRRSPGKEEKFCHWEGISLELAGSWDYCFLFWSYFKKWVIIFNGI